MSQLDISRIKAALNRVADQFEGKSVKVGWLEGSAYEDGTPVAYVASIQENGAPAIGIPARPFIAPAVEKHRQEWSKTLTDGAMAVARGQAKGDAILEGVGLQAQGDIQEQIKQTNSPPLSDVTLLLRKWRRAGKTITGKTVGQAAAAIKAGASTSGAPTAPLRDTGLLVSSINYQVGKYS